METLIAYCGTACGTCPIHLATLEPDFSVKQELRISIAGLCTEQYGMNLLAEDITDCDGCKANTGRLFSGCKECRIRPCARKKNLDNCSFCSEYPCEQLKAFFIQEPEARQNLEASRKSTMA